MPTFCRHNRLVQNCPICAREQSVAPRPLVSPAGRPEPAPRPAAPPRPAGARSREPRETRTRGARGGGLTVRRLARSADDGFASALVPGLRAAADAARLAEEIGFAVARINVLRATPPSLYAEVADASTDVEERIWLALQIAWESPLDPLADRLNEDLDPLRAIAAARVSWSSGAVPALTDAGLGPRAGGDPKRGERTFAAYRAWAARLGAQHAALAGEPAWTPERRFDRAFERLGTAASMDRGVRYDLLVTLGALGVLELAPGRLHVGGADPVTLAAKRIFGIGDPLLLERRSLALAEASAAPVAALDLGLFNWERGRRFPAGLAADQPADADAAGLVRAALGLD